MIMIIFIIYDFVIVFYYNNLLIVFLYFCIKKLIFQEKFVINYKNVILIKICIFNLLKIYLNN